MPIDGVSSPNTPYTPAADGSGSPNGPDPAVAAPPSSAAEGAQKLDAAIAQAPIDTGALVATMDRFLTAFTDKRGKIAQASEELKECKDAVTSASEYVGAGAAMTVAGAVSKLNPQVVAAGALLGHAVGHAAALVLRPAICQGDLR